MTTYDVEIHVGKADMFVLEFGIVAAEVDIAIAAAIRTATYCGSSTDEDRDHLYAGSVETDSTPEEIHNRILHRLPPRTQLTTRWWAVREPDDVFQTEEG